MTHSQARSTKTMRARPVGQGREPEPPVPTTKPKRNSRELTNAERHRRFVEMAREVGASDDAKAFDKAFKKVVDRGKAKPRER